MTLKEYIEKKVKELENENGKNIRLKSISPCKLMEFGGYSYMMFEKSTVPETVEVNPEWKPRMRTKEDLWAKAKEFPAAMFGIEYVPPRCRKPVSKYFEVALL